MSSSGWYGQETTSYSTRDISILLSIALGSGIFFILIATFFECLCCRRRGHISTGASIDRYNNTRNGLSPSDLNSLPTYEYKRFGDDNNGGGSGWAQCSVCMNLVQEGEKVRQLTDCKHLFHPECIDMWLYSHSTCPLCRSTVNPVQGGKNEVEVHLLKFKL
ncbi:hypothetical protein LUZ60_012519 [Juncus effusus]|nr:hypothetical protein LUZ60_012519 [Juncus effusus]